MRKCPGCAWPVAEGLTTCPRCRRPLGEVTGSAPAQGGRGGGRPSLREEEVRKVRQAAIPVLGSIAGVALSRVAGPFFWMTLLLAAVAYLLISKAAGVRPENLALSGALNLGYGLVLGFFAVYLGDLFSLTDGVIMLAGAAGLLARRRWAWHLLLWYHVISIPLNVLTMLEGIQVGALVGHVALRATIVGLLLSATVRGAVQALPALDRLFKRA